MDSFVIDQLGHNLLWVTSVCKARAGFVVTRHGPARPCYEGGVSGEAASGEVKHLHHHLAQATGEEAEHLLSGHLCLH